MNRTGKFGLLTTAGLGAIGLAVLLVAVALGSPWRSDAADPAEARACSTKEVKEGLRAFVRAFNRGDTDGLGVLFDDEPGFLWFSTGPPGERGGNAAFRRGGLMGYFERRHRRRDTMHIRGFGRIGEGHGEPSYERSTHFGLTLSRRADGYNRGRWFRMGPNSSKGAMICEGDQPRIFVMSLAGPPWIRR